MIPFFLSKFAFKINSINLSMFLVLKGGSQKTRLNLDSKKFFFFNISKTSQKNTLLLFFNFNLLIFISKILIAASSFSTKKTFFTSLDRHSNPKDPVPA